MYTKIKKKVSTVQGAKDMLGQHLGGACISARLKLCTLFFGVVWQQQLATGNLQLATGRAGNYAIRLKNEHSPTS